MRAWKMVLPVLLAMSGLASGATVYTQPGTTACTPSCWTSHLAPGGGFRAFDDFTLGTAATITSVMWQGIYLPQASSPTAPSPDTTTWTIGFYSDDGSFPDRALFDVSLPATGVTTTLLGSGSFDAQPVNLYSFVATLPSAFSAAAGTRYWFSPLSQATSFDPFFSWSPSTLAYDGLTAQIDVAGTHYNRPNDRAFSLVSDVPEPAAWATMIGGLAVTGGALRRRRRIGAKAVATTA